MADSQGGSCRSTWLVDPGIGHFVTRTELVQQHADLYQSQGFTRQFLWYAPEQNVTVPAGSPQRWSACVTSSSRSGNACLPGNVDTTPDHTISFDFGGRAVSLTSLAWAGNFIARVCGNTSLPLPSGSAPAPVPTINGLKFDDSNRNGNHDAGEGGVGGISFELIRTSSLFGDQTPGPVATTQSAADGTFGFALDGAGPGTYVVRELPQSGWVNTTAPAQVVTVPAGVGNAGFGVTFGNRAQHPPAADAGPSQTVDQTGPFGAAVTLDGSGSTDPDGDQLTYTWTGPFGTATGVTPTVTLPVGTWTITLTVDDGLAADSDTTTVTVYPPITAAGRDLAGDEGAPFAGPVATFTDPDPEGSAAEYSALIEWGDGTPATPGTIEKGDDGVFTVTGDHLYVEEGSFAGSVSIADTNNRFNSAMPSFTATIADAPLTASGLDLKSTGVQDLEVATFTDANPYGPLADFTATIDWGDGTAVSPGVITGPTGGPFSVAGSHTYATLGPKTIKVHIVDEGGQTADATTSLLLYALSSGGSFVIGDQDAVVGNTVTYWGAQWWKVNHLSGDSAPAAFKGFANSAAGTTDVTSWTTDPGNSAQPPASVPTYLAVIVSSSIGQSGSTISGNAPHVVIVRTDPAYAGNPGHEGVGTVVAVLR
ncbi:PKD domain-containing protein [Petropleomorpha daqingensis]|uniref:PKD/Chitinase domain-containing protein n=1 Tax=Petropleomorpha daqingensis TaxID=2026353 RepID=A0A853CCZ2_9ACTN|nr:PKD domain-containing protein [Petropleomorpha daqingensis]NYJ05885.1 hypothetical protein [Petropleomorpha daqingensis]